MSSTIPSRLKDSADQADRADVARSETVRRAKRGAGVARHSSRQADLAEEVKALLLDEVVDELLAGVGPRRRSPARVVCSASSRSAEIYGVKVGRDLISRVTDAVMDDARAWRTRPLEDVYPVVFLEALVLKIRDGGSVPRRAFYPAMAITMDGIAKCSACGFRPTRARSSGCRSSPISSTAASATS